MQTTNEPKFATGIAALLAASLCSCIPSTQEGNKAEQTRAVVVESHWDELLALDFSREIAALPALAWDDPTARAASYALPEAKPDSPGDEVVLAVRRIGDGYWSFAVTLTKLSGYVLANGSLPLHGAELLPDLATEEGYRRFMALSPEERLTYAFCAINPATGRFYAGFSGVSEPGGIEVTLLQRQGDGFVDPAGVSFNPLDENGQPEQTSGAYRYALLGDEPGEVLQTDYCTYYAPSH